MMPIRRCFLASKRGIRKSKNFLGTVKLLFQSAEESGNGAPFYIKNGILKDVDAALQSMCSLDCLLEPSLLMQVSLHVLHQHNLTITGTSAHGSTPHLGHDAIVAASAVIMDIQTLVSRIAITRIPLL